MSIDKNNSRWNKTIKYVVAIFLIPLLLCIAGIIDGFVKDITGFVIGYIVIFVFVAPILLFIRYTYIKKKK